jgi:hypothetical protein
VRLFFEDGTSAERTFVLPARSRTNVSVSVEFPVAAGRRFGAVVESLGATPTQIVVERAMYTSPGGVTWAAGTNALATPVPQCSTEAARPVQPFWTISKRLGIGRGIGA